MDVSLFERLINNGTPYSTLTKQHRMNLDITKSLVRPHFYKMSAFRLIEYLFDF